MSKLWTDEQFNCPVCLDLPRDPVTIPCGHSYCMGCIKDYWSKDDPQGAYSCPQCRKSFSPKPSLSRNTMLAEAVEQLRKGSLSSAMRESVRSTLRPSSGASSGGRRGDVRSAGLSPSAVPCDMCRGEPRAAVKSCLACMSSYCETHLKPHRTKAALKTHELIPPTGQLAQKICTQHKYLQEFYCRQCKIYVCWLCTSNEHKGHDSASTKAVRMERQAELSGVQTENHQKLKEREAELKEMKKTVEAMKRSSARVHEDAELTLSELQRSLDKLQELVDEVMDSTGQEKVVEAQEVVDQLEDEITERKRRDVEMKDLVRCEDNIYFLETFESLSSPLEAGHLPSVLANPEASYEPVRDFILDLREKVEDLCNQELDKITKTVNDTTLFTLGDSDKNGDQKMGGFLKLFGLGTRNTNNNRPQAPTPSVSVGVRGPERRGQGVGRRAQDVRSRDGPPRVDRGNKSPPRTRDRQRREEKEPVLAAPSPRPSPSPSPSPRPNPSPIPSRRESHSLWNRPEPTQVFHTPDPAPAPAPAPTRAPAPAPTRAPAPAPAPAPTPAPAPQTSSGFSRMASISSLFRSHRRMATPAQPAASTPAASTPAANSWGMGTVVESPTEVNPSLFLDSPVDCPFPDNAPSFPGLREISLDCIQAPEPRTREEFLQYVCNLVLDSNTAHRRLSLSEGNTKATLQGATQPYPDVPQRFDGWTQVLCRVPLSAQRCYWEVEWRGRGSSIGVAYGALRRKGSDSKSGLGYNAQSWSLELSDTCCSAMHDNEKKDIPVAYSPRVGLFLDPAVGTLSFYGVAESMEHLHTFRANFTQPLYAAFGVGSGVGVGLDFALGQFTSHSDSIKICPM